MGKQGIIRQNHVVGLRKTEQPISIVIRYYIYNAFMLSTMKMEVSIHDAYYLSFRPFGLGPNNPFLDPDFNATSFDFSSK